MVICPKCKTQYPDGEKFCKIHGAELLPAGPAEIEPPATDDGSRTDAQVKKLRAELARRDARIAELEKDLEGTRRELQTLRGTGLPSDTSSSESPVITDTETVDADVAGAPSTPHLVCLRGGSLEGKRFDIPKKGMLIGRKKQYAEQGGISIDNSLVSNPHAWVGIEKGKVILRDRKSTNGIYLDDEAKEPVKEKELNPGDTFIIADQSVAKFEFRR